MFQQVHQSVIISSLNCFTHLEASVSKNTHKSHRGELAVYSKLCNLLKCIEWVSQLQLCNSFYIYYHLDLHLLQVRQVRSYLSAISFLSKLQNTLDPEISCFKVTARNKTFKRQGRCQVTNNKISSPKHQGFTNHVYRCF